MKKRKAIILLSGGLDSTLIAYLMKKEGLNLNLLCLHFTSPFCTCNSACTVKSFAAHTTRKLGIPLKVMFMGDDYLKIISSPDHGYGKHMNPCIDCRIYKFSKAREVMMQEKADFIITGEVLGQRPMSQNLRSLKLIEDKAGLQGLVLRPLSANVLEATIPEKLGWVLREKLLSISGRSRKKQYKLAAEFGIKKDEYACPAGGCRLTMKEYSQKLRDLLKHNKKLSLKDVVLLSKGRHFRLSGDFKVITGRDESENDFLSQIATNGKIKMQAVDYKGTLCVGVGNFDKDKLKIMAGICGRYSDYDGSEKIKFICYNNKIKFHIEAKPFEDKKVIEYRV